ncbi:hypothetical protein IW261DRAFT_1489047, partial [Armillaria novae-zelandiae]
MMPGTRPTRMQNSSNAFLSPTANTTTTSQCLTQSLFIPLIICAPLLMPAQHPPTPPILLQRNLVRNQACFNFHRLFTDCSAAYPNFELYPLPFAEPVDQNSHPCSGYSAQPNVGLLQPHSNFSHHGSHCSQIPKLRIACAPGVSGQRTMWSFCEQCGAISMVDS